MSVTTPNTDIPTEDEIPALRDEIDHLDAEILRLIKRRSEVSQKIGRARMAAGGGPIKTMPALAQDSAKPAFSERNP